MGGAHPDRRLKVGAHAHAEFGQAVARRHPGVQVGLSPRAGLGLLRGARAHALLDGRSHVQPEDVQALFSQVAAHRLVPESESEGRDALAASILRAVAVD